MHSLATAAAMSQPKRPVALAVRGLSKRFERPAVDAPRSPVNGGEFYALLGPNGAGKTTTLAHGRRAAAAGRRRDRDLRHRCAGRSGRGQADHRLALRRADDLRQADAVRISRIRRRPLGRRCRDGGSARARSARLARSRDRTRTSAAKDSPRACGRRWRSAGALVHEPQADHPRRAADRPRRRLRAPGQERAARARRAPAAPSS